MQHITPQQGCEIPRHIGQGQWRPHAGQKQEQQQMNRRSTAAHQGVANQCLQQDQASVQSALVTVP